MKYRGVPVLDAPTAFALEPDGVVVSNVNPAQIDRAVERAMRRFAGPVLRLWEPQFLGAAAGAARRRAVRPLSDLAAEMRSASVAA